MTKSEHSRGVVQSAPGSCTTSLTRLWKDDRIMKVVHIMRRQPPGRFSMEGYFDRVRSCLVTEVTIRQYCLPHFSRGVWRRMLNMIAAARNQADVNHVTGDIHYTALLLKRSRTLLTVHDCEILCRLSGWKREVVRWMWYVLPARRASMMTVNSEETKRQLLAVVSFPADRIRVIPVSVSHLFEPSPKVFNQNCPRILQVGTKSNKNLLRLAEALNGLPCRLDIIGPLDDVQRQALTDNQIHFDNFLQLSDQEIVERYREADIVSFVSTHEGFGMPIVEAQWTERVCVTSNCSSMPEVAGDGACLVDPFEIASIRSGFLKVISDSAYRERLIENGRTNRLRFDSQRIANQFADLYAEMLRD